MTTLAFAPRAHHAIGAALRPIALALFGLALSLAAVAMPAHPAAAAVSDCHGKAGPDGRSHSPGDVDTSQAGHICIGCAAKGAPTLVMAPVALAASLPSPPRPVVLSGADTPPCTPPPRP